ncbi:MAG: NAD-dependent epimerase [Gammaproteobacteria bacterium]|nr:NAD-dependent epimerase [Gammaproteobacteria bacterium]MDH3374138.1 NAD-dependent epimerase [Gammaproteobacteria bacterium]MDH3410698.1 NAD-dependent epimerase [Gammaproteobacteria bacterium]
MKILVTGAAGFIGFFTAKQLLERGDTVVGLDNFNEYYDVSLKDARAAILDGFDNFSMVRIDLHDREAMDALFAKEKFDKVVHLAAQAGVRYSLENPHAYIDSNIVGTLHILEGCRHNEVKHLVYASSSSVYGANTKMPFSIHQNVDHPLALYGATKKANELMAHTYSSLYGLPTTGLRFFTVYGPYGRPDMALFMFTKNIIEGKPIDVFNYGNHKRDFTYIADIVEGVIRTMDHTAQPNEAWDPANPDPGTSKAPYRLYNIGNQQPVELMKYIEVIEGCVGKTAEKNLLPLQPGDVPDTWADTADLVADVDYQPSTPIEVGVRNFVDWYLEFYKDQLKQSA